MVLTLHVCEVACHTFTEYAHTLTPSVAVITLIDVSTGGALQGCSEAQQSTVASSGDNYRLGILRTYTYPVYGGEGTMSGALQEI